MLSLQLFAEQHGLSQSLTFYTLAIINAASVLGRLVPNLLTVYFGTLSILTIMSACVGAMCFALFGAGTPGGLIAVCILFGFFSGGYIALANPASISFANSFQEIGARIGLGLFITSFSALSGTPITGALLDKYGFYAPIIWSGTCLLAGSILLACSTIILAKRKKTWSV